MGAFAYVFEIWRVSRAHGAPIALASLRMRFLGFAFFGLLAVPGCSPDTPYRYTALTPAAHPLSWDGRTAKAGSLRLEGTFTRTEVETNPLPQLHDTAFHVPEATLEGVATLALSRNVELGVRYAYASYDWARISAVGTPPLEGRPGVWGIGPELRVAIPLDRRRRFSFGFGGNLMNYTTPYAEWQRCPCGAGANVFIDTSTIGGDAPYSLVHQSSENNWAFNIALYPSVNLNDDGSAGHIFGGLSAHTGFKNDGFTNVNQAGSTIQSAGLVYFLAVGYGVAIEPIRLSALLALPLTDGGSPVKYFLTGFLSVGVDVKLLEGGADADDRRRGAPAETDREDSGE